MDNKLVHPEETKESRKALIIEMFYGGLLCKCETYDRVVDYSTGHVEKEIQHHKRCEGRIKAQLMLDEENARVD